MYLSTRRSHGTRSAMAFHSASRTCWQRRPGLTLPDLRNNLVGCNICRQQGYGMANATGEAKLDYSSKLLTVGQVRAPSPPLPRRIPVHTTDTGPTKW